MDLWLPGYEHDPEPGAGHNPLPGNRKVIIHTTETGPGSLATVRNSWRGPANWAKGLAHFIAEGDRYVQLLPLDTCAYTSKGGPDAANKAGTPIQIEIVHRATNSFSDLEYKALGRWVAALVRAGIELDLEHCPRFYGSGEGIVLATETSPVRQIITRQFGGYAAFNGICGHQHLRGNDHWDPGFLDIHRVCDIAREHLHGGSHLRVAKEWSDMATREEFQQDLDTLYNRVTAEINGSIGNIERNLAALIRAESDEQVAAVSAGLKVLVDQGRLTVPDGATVDDLAGALLEAIGQHLAPKT